ncbi:hypothetical protein IE337_04105 [Weissella viridescens]|uniref:hypothetical protein n=1 Tax=Weissella viridescens TaxID=1629 RepID=UPI00174709CA|nr:hypothetical protein [Weissella viridescens]QOD85395.1 hypothetical protein IE337_04105 [Weissella viridescens]WJI90498.1 hypothetical protein PWA48_04080 [Weissella viridescens]
MGKDEVLLIGVYVVDGSRSENIKKLPFDNEQLKQISKVVSLPESDKLKPFDIESLNLQKKYYVDNDGNVQKEYVEHFLTEVKAQTSVKLVNSMQELFDGVDNKYDFVMYHFYNEQTKSHNVYFYYLNKGTIIKNKVIAEFEHTTAKKLKIIESNKSFSLPLGNCTAQYTYRQSTDVDGENSVIKVLYVYNAKDFDYGFDLKESVKVNHVCDQFKEEEYRLTSSEVLVKFSDLKEIKKKILGDTTLSDSFSNYSNHANARIKSISFEQLRTVIEKINEYVAKSPNPKFLINNIPTISESGGKTRLNITSESVPIFAALLTNTAVEKLLDNEIIIPYFKVHEQL